MRFLKLITILFVLSVGWCFGITLDPDVTTLSKEQMIELHKPSLVGLEWHIMPKAVFLYRLYDQAKDDDDFIKLVLHNDEGKSLQECISILSKNDRNLSETQKNVNKKFYAAIKSWQGLFCGLALVGGLLSLRASQDWIQEIYYKHAASEGLMYRGVMAMHEAFEPGFAGEGFSQAIAEGKVDVPESYVDIAKQAKKKYGMASFPADLGINLFVKEKLAGTEYPLADKPLPSFSSYLPRFSSMVYASTVIYNVGVIGFLGYVRNAYNNFQYCKQEHNQVMKKKEVGEKMLKLLLSVPVAN